MPAPDSALLDAARSLVRRAGLGAVRSLDRLSGGRNNAVYRVILDGGVVVVKHYHADERRRLSHEFAFLEYAWQRGVRNVPEPILKDEAANLGLLGYLGGYRIATEALTDELVQAAVDFVVALNLPATSDLRDLPIASEACFSIEAHLRNVEGRVSRLEALDPAAPYRERAENLVKTTLRPLWDSVCRRAVEAAESAGLDRAASTGRTWASPSDFGFHNALIDDSGRVFFFDFEYAGQDDIAKLVCDFFCQPEVPVGLAFFDPFLDDLSIRLELDDVTRLRCRLLLDVYRVKWCCIILNDFLPRGAARRDFSTGSNRAERCLAQLARAEANLASLSIS